MGGKVVRDMKKQMGGRLVRSRLVWAAGLALSLSAAPASAATFVDAIVFPTPGVVNPGPDLPAKIWSHDITGDLGGFDIMQVTITDALLTLVYSGVEPPPEEIWDIFGEHDLGTALVTLPESVLPTFVALPLPAGALASLQADGLFELRVFDRGFNSEFNLFSSALSGTFTASGASATPVPEPMTGLLFGLGLLTAVSSRHRGERTRRLGQSQTLNPA